MKRGVEIEIAWFDEDVIELRVRGSNGRFAGQTDLYAAHDGVLELAAALRGFPTSASDRRQFHLGTFEPSCAGGGCRLVFRCVDRTGHAIVDVTLRAEDDTEKAEFSVWIEAQAVSCFVEELCRIGITQGATARLEGAE